MLNFHGQTRNACEWVLKNCKDDPLSKNNMTTQSWVKACEEHLKQLDNEKIQSK